MTDTQHTPGPWSFDRSYGFSNGTPYLGIDSPEGTVAYVLLSSRNSTGLTTEKAIDQNAHLMAAAPELLEALDDLQIRYTSLFDIYVRKTYHASSDPQSDIDLALAMSNAATAKAKGDS